MEITKQLTYSTVRAHSEVTGALADIKTYRKAINAPPPIRVLQAEVFLRNARIQLQQARDALGLPSI